MKVIVCNDSDGHINAFEYNYCNLRALLNDAVTNGQACNSIFEEEDLVHAKEVLARHHATEAELEDAIQPLTGRSRGNRLDIVEINEYPDSCDWWG